MSTDLTKLRARVSAQERLTTILLARIEELAEDMGASFKQLVEYQTGTEGKIATQFDTIRTELATLATKAEVVTQFDTIRTELATLATKAEVATQFDTIRTELATLATKADISTLEEGLTATESRILDAFQQILTVIEARLPKE